MKLFSTIIALTCIFSFTSQAQFTQAYDPANWSTTLSPGSNGTVNTTGAPLSIVINGSDNNTLNPDVDVDFTIAAVASGAWAFNWTYTTTDGGGGADPAFVLVNGIATQLTSNSAPVQSNTFNGTANVGDVIGFRVRAIDDCCGSGVLTISLFTPPGGVLPVSLVSFYGKLNGKQIRLDWATASENESDRFEIERSADGTNFEKVGAVKAAGTTSQEQRYSFNDLAPVNDVNYYRLRQVDKNGKAVYSKTVLVKYTSAGSVSVYPNPARDIITINIGTVNAAQKETISLYSIHGKLLETRKVPLQTSTNNTVQWNVSGLASGQYYFRIGNATTPLPFVKK